MAYNVAVAVLDPEAPELLIVPLAAPVALDGTGIRLEAMLTKSLAELLSTKDVDRVSPLGDWRWRSLPLPFSPTCCFATIAVIWSSNHWSNDCGA